MIVKKSFDEAAQNKVLKLFKSKQVKTPDYDFYGALLKKNTVLSPRRNDSVSFFKSNIPEYTGSMPEFFKSDKNLVQAYDSNIKLRSLLPSLNPSQRKTLDSVVKGHELMELSTAKKIKPAKISNDYFGHVSPSVIFKEHNMLKTLPKNNEAVVGTMSAFRNAVESNNIKKVLPSFEHGVSPRFSRHAIKRLTSLITSFR